MVRPRRALSVLLCAAALSMFFLNAHAQTKSPAELYREAAAANERGDLQRAITLYVQLIKLQPESVEARTNFGVVLAHAGRYSDALAQYEQALKHAPDNPIVLLNVALAWYKQGDLEKAAAELVHLRKIQPENRQSLYLLADSYLRLGRYQDVVSLLSPIYQQSPDDAAVDYALGMALISSGQAAKGATVIDRILRNGSSAVTDMLLGAVQLAAGDHRTAAVTLRKALERDPALPGGWSLLARALLDENDGTIPNGSSECSAREMVRSTQRP